MSSGQGNIQNDEKQKLGRKLVAMAVKAGKNCSKNVLSRRKASQASRPQELSPAVSAASPDDVSFNIAIPVFASVACLSQESQVQASAGNTEVTRGSENRLQLSGLGVSRDPDYRSIEAMEIAPSDDPIPAVDRESEHMIPAKSSMEHALERESSAAQQNAPLADNFSASAQSEDPDTQRTLQKYEKAKQKMKDSLKFRRNEWGSFEFPQLEKFSDQEELSTLRNEINKVLDCRRQKDTVTNQTIWSKTKKVVENIFTATSPFAKNFLTVAKDAVQIPVLNPYGLLCGGLMLLITVHSEIL
jgi:hypothetical protein